MANKKPQQIIDEFVSNLRERMKTRASSANPPAGLPQGASLAHSASEKKGAVPDKKWRFLRWLLVLPGALVVVGLLPIPLHLAVLGLTRAGGFIQIPPEDAAALERALTPLVAAFGFVFGGACIAPTRRLATSILLSLLLVISVQVLRLYVEQRLATSSMHVVFTTRMIFFQVVGAGLGILGIVLKCRADRPIASTRRRPPPLAETTAAPSESGANMEKKSLDQELLDSLRADGFLPAKPKEQPNPAQPPKDG